MQVHPNDPDVKRLLSDADEFKRKKKEETALRLKTVDFHGMPDLPYEIWQIQLDLKHYKLGSGRTAKPGSPAASETGARPVYHLQLLVKIVQDWPSHGPLIPISFDGGVQ